MPEVECLKHQSLFHGASKAIRAVRGCYSGATSSCLKRGFLFEHCLHKGVCACMCTSVRTWVCACVCVCVCVRVCACPVPAPMLDR